MRALPFLIHANSCLAVRGDNSVKSLNNKYYDVAGTWWLTYHFIITKSECQHIFTEFKKFLIRSPEIISFFEFGAVPNVNV